MVGIDEAWAKLYYAQRDMMLSVQRMNEHLMRVKKPHQPETPPEVKQTQAGGVHTQQDDMGGGSGSGKMWDVDTYMADVGCMDKGGDDVQGGKGAGMQNAMWGNEGGWLGVGGKKGCGKGKGMFWKGSMQQLQQQQLAMQQFMNTAPKGMW